MRGKFRLHTWPSIIDESVPNFFFKIAWELLKRAFQKKLKCLKKQQPDPKFKAKTAFWARVPPPFDDFPYYRRSGMESEKPWFRKYFACVYMFSVWFSWGNDVTNSRFTWYGPKIACNRSTCSRTQPRNLTVSFWKNAKNASSNAKNPWFLKVVSWGAPALPLSR